MALPKFRRSPTDRKISGLFGGLGESFGIDPTYLRLAFVLLALVTGVLPAIAAYAIGWLVTTEGPAGGAGEAKERAQENPPTASDARPEEIRPEETAK
jgi:phage shock protein C